MSSKSRLTRQELGWLLTQEATGAAERLRTGVQVLRTNIPPPTVSESADVHVEASLDALDDVMRMLSNLHARPSAVRGRRGRIDLAALLWEVAPDARVSIEPGSGTEVFGDEGELRRMLHVLVGYVSGTNSEFAVRREGDNVRVSVSLGPDSPATAVTERAWLSRMALRYGGRLELEGGSAAFWLPAYDVAASDEREALRRELDEARRQGEAYARELAAAFAQGEEAAHPSTFPPLDRSGNRLGAVTQLAQGVAGELRNILFPLGRELAQLRAELGPSHEERLETARRRLVGAQDFVAELALLGEVDEHEPSSDVDAAEVFRGCMRQLAGRADRSEVTVRCVTVPESETRIFLKAPPRAFAVLARALLAHAILASPRGAEVVVTLQAAGTGESPDLGTRIRIDDQGAPLPSTSRRALLALELDPGTFGRPSSIPLFCAAEIASATGALLELDDSPGGGVRVSVTYPR